MIQNYKWNRKIKTSQG